MIQIGILTTTAEPDLGVRMNIAGTIVFKGNCQIDTNSCFHIGEKGNLMFANNFLNSAGLILDCYHRIEFKENVRVGPGTLIMDTDSHAMQKVAANSGEGTHQDQRLRCVPHRQKLLACLPQYSVISGNPAKLKFTGVWRDPSDGIIDYE